MFGLIAIVVGAPIADLRGSPSPACSRRWTAAPLQLRWGLARSAVSSGVRLSQPTQLTSALYGYEAYLVVFAAAAHEPERAEAILPTVVTLARLIDIAHYDISQGGAGLVSA